MRADIPGQAIVKLNASITDLFQDSIGIYYPHMQRPPGSVVGSWQDMKRMVEIATMYLGSSGQNDFLHTTVSPIIPFVTIPHLTVFVSHLKGLNYVTSIRDSLPSSRHSYSAMPNLWVTNSWMHLIP